MLNRQPAVTVVLLAAAFVVEGFAQDLAHRHGLSVALTPATIRLDADLVLVPVTVTDNRGRLIGNLARADFTLLEEKSPQQLVSFSRESAPISLGIVVDLSGSMARKMDTARAAVNELLRNLEPSDEEFLVTFADKAELRSTFHSDPSMVRGALAAARPDGRTALFDAVHLAIRQMRHARHQRKVLFLVSDGGDNHSRITERQLRRVVEEEDVQIHAIGIHEGPASSEERNGPWILDDLAKMTGGQHYMITSIGELPELAARVSLSLHDRYLLGYRPTPPAPSGKFRRIEVKVMRPRGAGRLSVYARRGYQMP